MGGTAPANQLRAELCRSEDGEAETEPAEGEALVANDDSNLRPAGASTYVNARCRTRRSGGVGGASR